MFFHRTGDPVFNHIFFHNPQSNVNFKVRTSKFTLLWGFVYKFKQLLRIIHCFLNNYTILLVAQYGLFVFLFPFKAFTRLKHTNTSFEIVVHHDTTLYSTHLHRKIVLDIVLPPHYNPSGQPCKVLYMNDGQDLRSLHLTKVLDTIYQHPSIEPFIVVAIHCGERIQEYGTASQPDYKNRGARAGAYTRFVLEELMPHIQQTYRVKTGPENTVFVDFRSEGCRPLILCGTTPIFLGKSGRFRVLFGGDKKPTKITTTTTTTASCTDW